jgi:hypothetical protein
MTLASAPPDARRDTTGDVLASPAPAPAPAPPSAPPSCDDERNHRTQLTLPTWPTSSVLTGHVPSARGSHTTTVPPAPYASCAAQSADPGDLAARGKVVCACPCACPCACACECECMDEADRGVRRTKRRRKKIDMCRSNCGRTHKRITCCTLRGGQIVQSAPAMPPWVPSDGPHGCHRLCHHHLVSPLSLQLHQHLCQLHHHLAGPLQRQVGSCRTARRAN